MPFTSFSTDRFLVQPWGPLLRDADTRQSIELALHEILTPAVTAHLPGALHLGQGARAASEWIDARDAESDVLTITAKADGRLIGLVILAPDPTEAALHVGYLLAERVWGQGAASEVLTGFVASLRNAGPVRLVGGVDRDNPASARVLEKAGFALDPVLSTPHSALYGLDIA